MPNVRRSRLIVGVVLLFALAGFLIFCARSFVADRFLRAEDLSALKRASRLDPWNATVWRSMAEKENIAEAAIGDARHAVALNPRDAAAWLELAFAEQETGDPSAAANAVARALRADPTTPMYLRTAAQLYFSLGQQKAGLEQLRNLATHDPDSLPNTVDLAWRATHNPQLILSEVVPHNPDGEIAFLRVLIARDQRFAAGNVWKALVSENAGFDPSQTLAYVNFLLDKFHGAEAAQVWQILAARNRELSEYRVGDNAITNSGFEQPILASGLDWRYAMDPAVTVRTASGEAHAGLRALELDFGAAVVEPGIWQYVPVAPGGEYDFSAYYKTHNLEGAGGIAWAAIDVASGAELGRTPVMAPSDEWQPVGTQVTVPAQSDLIIGKLLRTPAGDQLRGSLWIDDVSLRPRR